MSNTMKQIYMYLAFFIMVGVNALANLLPINGYSTGEVSNMYDVYFTPASYTFSIWTVIYISLFLWLLSFTFKFQRLSNAKFWGFILTCVFNSLWIVLWHYLLDGFALIDILALFLTLVFLYQAQRSQNNSVIYRFPISLYIGWITVASITNTLYWLVASVGIEAGTQMLLTYLALTVVVIIGFGVILILRDWVIILVFIWSLTGIFVKNLSDHWPLAIVTIILAGLLAAGAVLYWLRTRKTA